MGILFTGLGGILYLAAFVCGIIVLVDAFKNEIWKGVVYFLCFPYALYYLFAEFEHDKKLLIILIMFLGGIGGYVLLAMGGVGSPPMLP